MPDHPTKHLLHMLQELYTWGDQAAEFWTRGNKRTTMWSTVSRG